MFRDPEIIPRYLWSHEEFLSFDFSWYPIRKRCSDLKDTIKSINQVSWLLSNPEDMWRADDWDRLVVSTRNYQHNFIRNTIPIENTSEKENLE